MYCVARELSLGRLLKTTKTPRVCLAVAGAETVKLGKLQLRLKLLPMTRVDRTEYVGCDLAREREQSHTPTEVDFFAFVFCRVFIVSTMVIPAKFSPSLRSLSRLRSINPRPLRQAFKLPAAYQTRWQGTVVAARSESKHSTSSGPGVKLTSETYCILPNPIWSRLTTYSAIPPSNATLALPN